MPFFSIVLLFSITAFRLYTYEPVFIGCPLYLPSHPLCTSVVSKTVFPHRSNITKYKVLIQLPRINKTSFCPSPFGEKASGTKKQLSLTYMVTLSVLEQPS